MNPAVPRGTDSKKGHDGAGSVEKSEAQEAQNLQLPKLNVVGSNPITRSNAHRRIVSQVVAQRRKSQGVACVGLARFLAPIVALRRALLHRFVLRLLSPW